MPQTIHIREEYFRKSIHVLFTSCILFICYLPKQTAYNLLAITLLTVFLYEQLRHHNPLLRQLLKHIRLHTILRQHEKNHWTGASYVVIATALCYFLFPQTIFILSLLVLGWADSAAAIFGRHFAQATSQGKSMVGSFAFFMTSFGIVCLLSWYWSLPFVLAGGLASFFAMLAERYSSRFWIDDNLSIPLIFAWTIEVFSSNPTMFAP